MTVDASHISELIPSCLAVACWHMTDLWDAKFSALSLHSGDRLPCEVVSDARARATFTICVLEWEGRSASRCNINYARQTENNETFTSSNDKTPRLR